MYRFFFKHKAANELRISDWSSDVGSSDLTDRLRFGDLAAAAAGEDVPDPLPLRGGQSDRLYGQSLPRIDVPAKVDGSANFAGDIRLPGKIGRASCRERVWSIL